MPDNASLTEVIVKYNGDIQRVVVDLGGQVEILDENYGIVTINAADLARLMSQKEVEYLERAKTLTRDLNEGVRESCIQTVQSEMGSNLRGKGVLIAIIDSGIDYAHLDFRNEDGTSRILYIWDQAKSQTGVPPLGFRYGIEYNQHDLNDALKEIQPYNVIPMLDPLGHGTAVAGVAAGELKSQ